MGTKARTVTSAAAEPLPQPAPARTGPPAVSHLRTSVSRRRLPRGSQRGILVSCVVHAAVLILLALVGYQSNAGRRGSDLEPLQVAMFEKLDQPAARLTPTTFSTSARNSAGPPLFAAQAVQVSVPGVPFPSGYRPSRAGQGGTFDRVAGQLGGGGRLLRPLTSNHQGAEFFGVAAKGSRFVFVVDSSGSMMLGERWQMACQELLESVSRLGKDRFFYVVFFDTRPHPMFEPLHAAKGMLAATEKNQQLLRQWMSGIQMGPATKPLGAIRKAISLKPDAIYLLSDGEFQDATALYLRRRKKTKGKLHPIVIHTIGLDSIKGRRVLERIARENGGAYRLVPGSWTAQLGRNRGLKSINPAASRQNPALPQVKQSPR